MMPLSDSAVRQAEFEREPGTPVPPMPYHRVVIIGAGAVGSHLVASLRPEISLMVIDPAEQVRSAYAFQGIDARAVPAPADTAGIPSRTPFRTGDVAVLATSAGVAAAAARSVPAWVPMVCVSNGLTPELAAVRNHALSYGVVEFAVSSIGAGRSRRTRDGWLTLQRQSDGNVTAWLAAALEPRMQRVRLADDIDAHRHGKLMLNASLDPVAAVIGGAIGDVFRGRDSFRAFRALLDEALTVARAAGWRLHASQGVPPAVLSAVFATPLVNVLAARAAGWQARAVGSTLSREIVRGDLGEAEYLCGAIASEGARVGVPTPAHDCAMNLLRRIAGQPGGNGGRPELARELVQC